MCTPWTITANRAALPCASGIPARRTSPLCRALQPQTARHSDHMVTGEHARSTGERHVDALPCAPSRQRSLPCAYTRQTAHMALIYSVFCKIPAENSQNDRKFTEFTENSQNHSIVLHNIHKHDLKQHSIIQRTTPPYDIISNNI